MLILQNGKLCVISLETKIATDHSNVTSRENHNVPRSTCSKRPMQHVKQKQKCIKGYSRKKEVQARSNAVQN